MRSESCVPLTVIIILIIQHDFTSSIYSTTAALVNFEIDLITRIDDTLSRYRGCSDSGFLKLI
jgi:hypothetical protein